MRHLMGLRQIRRSSAGSKARTPGWVRTALVVAIGMLWLISAGLAGARSPRQAISSDVFWQRVDQTLAWLDTRPAVNSPEWQAEASRWEKIREISLSDQQMLLVDTSYIVQQLRAKSPDSAKLSAYLTSLKATRALTTPTGGEREANLLAGILARSEFQYNRGEQNLIQKILDWLSEQYNRLMDLLFGNLEGEITIPSNVTLSVTLLVITAVLIFVFRDTLRNLFSESELAEETPGEGEFLTARLANQKAQELSSGGDYRHALRYLYLSALLLLDERGLLRYNRAETNREYLRQVRSRPDLSDHLKIVVETFDRVWYGYQPMDEASYARYAEHVTALEETKE